MDTVSKIFLLLNDRNVEQKALAEYLGISKSTITQWKSGNTQSYHRHIDKIAAFFDVSTDFLLNDSALPDVTKKEPLQNLEAVFKLYNALLDYGLIKPDEELTDERIKLILDFLVANRQFLDQLSEEGK